VQKSLTKQSISKQMMVFLVVSLVAASWLSIGFFHPDEHYQIIEFSSYLLGRSPAEGLPWEFHHQIRPWLQPALTAIPMWIGFLVTDSPYLVSAFLKICYGSLYLVALIWFCRSYFVYQQSQAKPGIGIGWNQYIFFMLVSPVVGLSLGRTSSESLGTVILLLIVSVIYRYRAQGVKLSSSMHFWLGCLIAIMFFVRFQMAFAYVAIAAWFLFIDRTSWSRLVANATGFLLLSTVLVGLDSYFYGTIVVTPWQYFSTNLIDGVAANFGISPWWYYFVGGEFSILGVFLRLCLWAWLLTFWSMRRSLIAWIVLFFVLGHSMIGHKEDRFLFPIIVFGPLFLMQFFKVFISSSSYKDFFTRSAVKRFVYLLLVFFFLRVSLSIRHRDFYSLASIEMNHLVAGWLESSTKNPCVEWKTDRQYPMMSKKLWSNFFKSPLMEVKDLTLDEDEKCTTDKFFAVVRQTQREVFRSQIDSLNSRDVFCKHLRIDHRFLAYLSQRGYLDWIASKELNGKDIALYECRQASSL
jgi:phosphatidylinositol glycan class B